MKFEIGKRYLVKNSDNYSWDNSVIEIKVLELSKTRVKMEFPNGKNSWKLPSEYKIEEELASPRRKWTTLEQLREGAIFETKDHVLAVKSEYRYSNENLDCQCILLSSGEYAHFPLHNKEPVREINILIAKE